MIDRMVKAAILALAMVLSGAQASNRAVIIQAWKPTEATGLDWAPEGLDTLDELWNDCYLAYEMWCARPGIDTNPDRIHFLWADAQDFPRQGTRYNPYLRLGLRRISDDTACRTTVTNTFNALASQVGTNETLFVYTWGHGKDSLGIHQALLVRPIWRSGMFWYGTPIWDYEFARIVDTVKSKRVFVMQQCRSGGFCNDLADSSTIFLAATPANRKAHSADGESHNGSPLPEHEPDGGKTWRHAEFNFHLMNALRGTAVWSYEGGYDNPVAVDADYNDDGTVSWREAYWYIDSHNSYSRNYREYPVFFSPDTAWYVMRSVGDLGKTVSDGGALAAVFDTSSTIYALKGNKTRDFWAYDVASDSWRLRREIPGDKTVSKGGTLASPGNGYVYATKGSKTLQFWKYSPAFDTWTAAADVPVDSRNKKMVSGATAGVWDPGTESSFVFLLKGKTGEFYRYNCATNAWASRDTPPRTGNKKYDRGCALAYDGAGSLYLLKNKTNDLLVYSVAGDSWCLKSPMPLVGRARKSRKVKPGGALASCGGTLYALKGSSSEFWTYEPGSDFWYQPDTLIAGPSGKTIVKGGGSLAVADGFVFAMRGNKTCDFMRFTPNLMYRNAPLPQEIPVAPGAMELLVAEGTDCADPRLSRSGDRVAFVMSGTNNHVQVHTVSSNGGNVLELTALEGECRSPVWSPQPPDDRIAFVYEPEDSAAQIAVVSSQGGAVTRLVKGLGDVGTLAWSPDGSSLVFDCDSGNWTQLWRYSFPDSSVQVLTTSQANHFSPVFASNTEIVFTLEPAEGPGQIGKLYQYAPDTAAPGNLVWAETTLTASACEHANPCVAASAGLVFFEVEGYDGYTMIGKVALSGGTETVLASGECDFELPTTGPEGETLYCLRSSDGGAAICEVYADASGYEDKTDDAVERESPHARQDEGGSACAVYVRDGSVYRTRGQGERGQQGSGLGVFALEGARPNPNRGRVSISWQLPYLANVRLQVYDPAGRLVRTLVSGEVKPGRYTSVWDGTDTRSRQVGTGIYFARLRAAGRQLTRKVILQR